jgi:hypothetical protein
MCQQIRFVISGSGVRVSAGVSKKLSNAKIFSESNADIAAPASQIVPIPCAFVRVPDLGAGFRGTKAGEPIAAPSGCQHRPPV